MHFRGYPAIISTYIRNDVHIYVMNKLASKQDAEHPTTYLS